MASDYLSLAKAALGKAQKDAVGLPAPRQGHEENEVNEEAPPAAAWDQACADAALAACIARLERGLREHAKAPTRRNVIELTRRIVTRHHAERDPVLWTDLDALEAMLARWRAAG
jgi:hypothetical protein